jgi:hypothetical protein
MSAQAILPMGGFYQFGYVTREIEPALATLGAMFGISKVRRRRSSEWMETAHAWTGRTMIEVIAPGEDAPPLFTQYLPARAGVLQLHHLGHRIETAGDWAYLEQAIHDHQLEVPFAGSLMDGQLHYAYVDTRAALGIYTEYVCLSGAALRIYDDVPQSHCG